MIDIALLWETKLLFEKFFIEHGFNHNLVHPASIGSPFLPKFKLLIIPTGFANPKYSNVLPALMKNKHTIEHFISNGGTLLVFGALIDSHFYDWLPVEIEYVQRYGPVELSERCRHEVSLLAGDSYQECDGFFCNSDGECILTNENDEAVLLKIDHGEGLIIATTIHEFPAPEFIRWALDHATFAKL
jgi:hypothetical protein